MAYYTKGRPKNLQNVRMPTIHQPSDWLKVDTGLWDHADSTMPPMT